MALRSGKEKTEKRQRRKKSCLEVSEVEHASPSGSCKNISMVLDTRLEPVDPSHSIKGSTLA